MPERVTLTCEHRVHPLGIDGARPRLGWHGLSIRPSGHALTLFDGDRICFEQNEVPTQPGWLDVPIELMPRTRYRWTLDGHEAWFETGWLGTWDDSWLSVPLGRRESEQAYPVVRYTTPFVLPDKPVAARLYLAARGVAAGRINDQPVSDHALSPGWTATTARRLYETVDVTDLVPAGENTLSVELAEGWASGRLGWAEESPVGLWEEAPSLRVALVLRLPDGREISVDSSSPWQAEWKRGQRASIYDGWYEDLSADTVALDVLRTPDDGVPCIALPCKPIHVVGELSPVRTERKDNGLQADFGQNAAGWIRGSVASSGRLKILHAEMLDEQGEVYLENLRSARAEVTIENTENEINLAPRHTFMGFRHVVLKGASDAKDLRLQALSSADCNGLQVRCSDPRIEQLVENTRWGLRSNLLSVPTDCPQRDERLGWTGDVLAIAPTACLYGDPWLVLKKWLFDLGDGQYDDGALPDVAPDCLTISLQRSGNDPYQHAGHDAWGDAAVFVPWVLYEHTDDERILRDHRPMMERWMTWRENHFNDPDEAVKYGDWLAPQAPSPGEAPTPKRFIRQAFSIRCADLMARIAAVLGESPDRWLERSSVWRAAFVRDWLTEDGGLSVKEQTASCLALSFDLVEQDHVIRDDLVAQVEAADRHLATGFVGTPLLLPTLSRMGRSDLAWDILLQTTYPGWLFSVEAGATTAWERWDSYHPEKGFSETGMNSFNHYAYGCVVEWIITYGLGLRSVAPGWSRVAFTPAPDHRIGFLNATLETPRGRVRAGWNQEHGDLQTELALPPGIHPVNG